MTTTIKELFNEARMGAQNVSGYQNFFVGLQVAGASYHGKLTVAKDGRKYWLVTLEIKHEGIGTVVEMQTRADVISIALTGLELRAQEWVQALEVARPTTLKWIPVTERMPDPELVVIVACPAEPHRDYYRPTWSRACWIPKHFKETIGDDYDGDLDYSDEKDEFYWPEGWYEWNMHEDVHWKLPTTVAFWAEVELPALEPTP